MTVKKKIEPYEYIGGRDFTSKVVKVMGLERYNQLTDVLGVNKGTISTWHTRNMTPFELAVRIHLSEGVSLKWLLLDEGEPFPEQNSQDHVTKKNESRVLFDIDVFNLVNGKLQGNETLPFDKAYLDKLGLLNAMGIEQDGSTFIIDKEVHQAVSGTYLVDMDGLFSLNEIQRLPGKKLAISFNGSTLTVEEDEVRVVGRVALVMEKK
ncbi:helix-turn-helix domain-containing protein [Vibrio alginolyticus]|uniref:helix-turn-helix domain-containing protein n=1 Tax=Vibrio alginolyticus TaxID=663 RepID=UPI0012AE977B|nr:helix-turn-helix domain-containing protein [Vibrio alginolyticus]EKY4213250.1 helix-turn-helix domain-containing protein [Vibrio alginolyticus]MDF4869844.1 helix-turn-helix domain-containing protein [Vibrio parahaemolyticus]